MQQSNFDQTLKLVSSSYAEYLGNTICAKTISEPFVQQYILFIILIIMHQRFIGTFIQYIYFKHVPIQ